MQNASISGSALTSHLFQDSFVMSTIIKMNRNLPAWWIVVLIRMKDKIYTQVGLFLPALLLVQKGGSANSVTNALLEYLDALGQLGIKELSPSQKEKLLFCHQRCFFRRILQTKKKIFSSTWLIGDQVLFLKDVPLERLGTRCLEFLPVATPLQIMLFQDRDPFILLHHYSDIQSKAWAGCSYDQKFLDLSSF